MCYACASNGAWGAFAGSNAYGYKTGMLPPDGVGGDLKSSLPVTAPLLLTVDAAPADASTDEVLTVDGPVRTATIDTVGDQDWYRVELVAGQTYNVGMFLKAGGPSGVPLADAYIELYDSAGNLLTNADGGGPNTPQGLDALLTFTAETSGTYFINARAYDQEAANGTDGDGVGDYDIFVERAAADPNAYRPYYDIDSPLHSLDWGTQKARSSRNPDGDNGPRDNGNAFMGAANSYGFEGKNVFTYYFAKVGDVFLSEDPTTPGVTADIVQLREITQYERDAYRASFAEYERVADVIYIETQNRNEADFKIITYNGTPGPGASLLGRASPPGEESEGQMEYNAGDERYTEAGLTQGGFFFTTILHEMGHAHGLAHPHDNGGRSSIMRGAGGGTGGIGGGYGDFGLSQGVYTIMSYNDGWDLRPDGTGKPDDNADYGWVGTLSPLDIAVIQDKYGVNEDTGRGDDVYTLKDVNARGTFYSSIWDAAGRDAIRYDGARDAVIDLRAATLKYEEGGGGFNSYVKGIHGGFTIANGVTIEHAYSGAGNDRLTGNAVGNKLDGGAGDDVISGGGGADVLWGQAGRDVLDGGDGNDTFYDGAGQDTYTGGAGADLFIFASLADTPVLAPDRITDFEAGVDVLNVSRMDGNVGLSGRQGFTFVDGPVFTAPGQVRVVQVGQDTHVLFNNDGDLDPDAMIVLSGARGVDGGDFIF